MNPGGGAFGSDARRTVVLALAVALAVRGGALVFDADRWYLAAMPPLVVLAPALWLAWRRADARAAWTSAAWAAAVAVALALLPSEGDAANMARAHAVVILAALFGVAYAGAKWRSVEARVDFVRAAGELFVVAALVAAGGMVFSALTIGLFEVPFDGVEDVYFRNVGIMGAAAIPVVALFVWHGVLGGRTRLAPVLARVFAPLFLVMTVAYVVITLAAGKNPFLDRDFLVSFDALLAVVLGIALFSMAERGADSAPGASDRVVAALVAVMLVVDVIALAGVAYRGLSYGWTPHRLTALGDNVVIFGHLAWLARRFTDVLRARATCAALHEPLVRYLPVYVAWAAVVVVGLPLVFR